MCCRVSASQHPVRTPGEVNALSNRPQWQPGAASEGRCACPGGLCPQPSLLPLVSSACSRRPCSWVTAERGRAAAAWSTLPPLPSSAFAPAPKGKHQWTSGAPDICTPGVCEPTHVLCTPANTWFARGLLSKFPCTVEVRGGTYVAGCKARRSHFQVLLAMQ